MAKGIWSTRDLIYKDSCYLIGDDRSVDLGNAPWFSWLNSDDFQAAFNPMRSSESQSVFELLSTTDEQA
ncbi:hypothetical protein TorRG33x02_187470 [Trema orientale]|uniref:Uncharacterized protein n=1 Tax=Trema orientale TaxID=63057 RepID=A0A2P5EIT8_TREOI|nr:hypothetical protein TorRG33x02_187470 [Trema orientale]